MYCLIGKAECIQSLLGNIRGFYNTLTDFEVPNTAIGTVTFNFDNMVSLTESGSLTLQGCTNISEDSIVGYFKGVSEKLA